MSVANINFNNQEDKSVEKQKVRTSVSFVRISNNTTPHITTFESPNHQEEEFNRRKVQVME